jgi:hypothetical protein
VGDGRGFVTEVCKFVVTRRKPLRGGWDLGEGESEKLGWSEL